MKQFFPPPEKLGFCSFGISNRRYRYNNTRHSSIKMTPVQASKTENELRVWRNLYPQHLEIHDLKPKFSVGDKVRISKKKNTFEKGYTTRWTEEIFTIVEVKRTSPVTYKIADLNGEEIQGTFTNPNFKRLVKSCLE